MAHIKCYSALGLLQKYLETRKPINFLCHIHVYEMVDYELLLWMEKYKLLNMNDNKIKLKEHEENT
jgi:hypothetical protein